MTRRRRFTEDELNRIYERTSGKCHICRKKLAFKNYGRSKARAAWHVDHSRAVANGGTNRLSNLYAACIVCNLEEGTVSTRTARSWVGRSRAPLSPSKRKEAKAENALVGAALGGLSGAVFGPPGAILGALIGAAVGHDQDPDD